MEGDAKRLEMRHRERKLKCDKRGKRGGGAGSLKRERGEIKTYDLTLIVL